MKTLQELKDLCLKANFPIMADESLDFILTHIAEGSNLLELGSCAGYSSIYLAKHQTLDITSIERDFERHLLAKQHVQDFGLETRIHMIYDDALVFEPKNTYDIIIFDAAKAQNHVFFQRYFPYLKESGILFIDNMDFHGYVSEQGSIKSRNLRKMVRAISDFEKEIAQRGDLESTHLPLGDGLLMIKKVKTESYLC